MPSDRRDLRRRLFATAAEHGGYFSAAQARRLGYSYQAQAHHVAAGNWARVDRGLFRLVDWVSELHDDLALWTLLSGGRGVVSHESAAAVHAIGEVESGMVHLTVPPGFSRTTRGVVLHPAVLVEDDSEQRTGFRVTTPARTIIDVAAAGADEDHIARMLADAIESGAVEPEGIGVRAEVVDVRAALTIERALHSVRR